MLSSRKYSDMNDKKWKFAELDPLEKTPEQKEYSGMMVVLCTGLLLLFSGLIFAWKINAFNAKAFFETDVEPIFQNRGLSLYLYLAFFHIPWITGAWMTTAAVKYF